MPNDNIDVSQMNEVYDELLKGTSGHLVSETSKGVLHDRPKVLTPIPQLNCIFGGGIPLGIIVEAYGDPASGKSSVMYKMLGNFQEQYPKGISVIVDTEASVDSRRMKFLGVDSSKVIRIPATTLEEGFSQVFKILDKKVTVPQYKDLPVFILWDTIGISPTNKEINSDNQYSEGMMGHAKLIKHELSRLLPRIEEQPILVVLLNQVISHTDAYGHGSLVSGGGWGLKHNAHLRLQFSGGKSNINDIFVVSKNSSIDIVKSKISPLFSNISFSIDVTKGGSVDSILSMLLYARNQLAYITSDAWAKISKPFEMHPEYDHKFDKFCSDGKSFRWTELVDYARKRPKIVTLLELCFLDEICSVYSYQSEICEDYRKKLIAKMEEPEPYEDENGNIVDRWTGNIISKKEDLKVSEENNEENNNEENLSESDNNQTK